MKREILNDIQQKTPAASPATLGAGSTEGEYAVLKDRIERAEAEITLIKDEQVNLE